MVRYCIWPDLGGQETKQKENKKKQTKNRLLSKKQNKTGKETKDKKIPGGQKEKKQNKTKNKNKTNRKVRNKKQNKTEKRQNNGKKRGRFLVPGQAVHISFQFFGHFYSILPAEPCTRVSPFLFREVVYP